MRLGCRAEAICNGPSVSALRIQGVIKMNNDFASRAVPDQAKYKRQAEPLHTEGEQGGGLPASALWEAYERERRIAAVLQRSLMRPSPRSTFPGLCVEVCCEAAEDESLIGGDFYDAFALEGNKTALVVGDICGKGLAAAEHIPEVRFALRAFLRERPDPGRALARTNRFLCSVQKERPEDSFAVVSVAVMDGTTGETQCVTAGAEPPLVFRAQGGLETVSAARLPLGVAPQQRYPAVSLHLDPGDILMLLTDGLTEARRGQEFLGYEGLAELSQKAVLGIPLEEGAQAILDQVRAFCGGKFRDDVCLLLAQRA